jgi:phosphate transport system substrate-binding protein
MKQQKVVLAFALLASLGLVACQKADPAIVVYTRDGTSGTRDGFTSAIGFSEAKSDDSKLAKGYVEVASNGDMITAVKKDQNGIGYISLSTLNGSGVSALAYEGVSPSEANVLNNTYKMTRSFNYLVRAEYSDAKVGNIAKAFVAFMGTSDGKATMKQLGGILTVSSSDPTWDSIKANYPIAGQDNSAVTLRFGGSTSVEEMAKALSAEFSPLCGHFIANHNHTGSGDAYKKTQGSAKDSTSALDIAFASREFNASEPYAAGTAGKMCTDAIVPVINALNKKITSISAAQLKAIYSGASTKWSQLA